MNRSLLLVLLWAWALLALLLAALMWVVGGLTVGVAKLLTGLWRR
jgi:hypothetical protein